MSALAAIRDFGQRVPSAFSFAGAVVIFFATIAASGGAGSGQVLTTALTFATMYVIVGLGQMFVITTGPGNIDLSIPATIALAGAVAMRVMNGDNAMILPGVASALAVGAAVGCFNYGLIRLLSIPPIIATLSSALIVQSVAIAYGRPDATDAEVEAAAIARIERVDPVLHAVAFAAFEQPRRAADPGAPLSGVQFHPESIGTPEGSQLLRNFINFSAN